MNETPVRKRRQPVAPPKSKCGPKTRKTDRVVEMLQRPGGATLEEMADEIGWKVTAVTRIVQWMLFTTRSGVRRILTQKREDGTTVYRAA